jgi:hypothetical protein
MVISSLQPAKNSAVPEIAAPQRSWVCRQQASPNQVIRHQAREGKFQQLYDKSAVAQFQLKPVGFGVM